MAKKSRSPDAAQRNPGEDTHVDVRLLHPHTHGGRDYPAEDVIAVTAPVARWLIGNGIGELAETSTP